MKTEKRSVVPKPVPEALPHSPPVEDQSAYVTRGDELRLSNPGQLKLLLAMKERGMPLKTTVRGFSMAPFIRDLDVLTIVPLGNRLPRVGEVVAFKHPDTDRLVLHRIIKPTASGWLLKGDNCREPDGEVSPDLILGRVTRVERRGYIVRLGLGRERGVIALLNRGPGLALCKQLWLLPRRAAGSILSRVRGFALYRRFGRRFTGHVEVCAATESDLEQAHRLLNPAAPYRRPPMNPLVANFVARTGSRVIGFVQMVERPSEQAPWAGRWLHSLQVRNAYRGLGIGTKLTRRVIEAAADEGAAELLLAVSKDNREAIGLYAKLGFSEVTLPGFEPLLAEEEARTGRRRIVMRKNLG